MNLGVDAEADFHQYDIEWTPAGVKYCVDGTLLRTSTSAPTSADVDWIKVYSWNG